MCITGKTGHETPQRAWRVKEEILRRNPHSTHGTIDIYRCPHCGKYHLTRAKSCGTSLSGGSLTPYIRRCKNPKLGNFSAESWVEAETR